MQYFTEEAPTHREALERVRAKYGDQAQILSHRTLRSGGLFGLFARESVEVTGYLRLRPTPPAAALSSGGAALQTKQDLEEEKRKILAQARTAGEAGDKGLERVLSELRELKETVINRREPPPAEAEHESLRRAEELLVDNDFSEPFRRNLVGRLRRDFTLEALENWDEVQNSLLEWIGDSLELYREETGPRPRVLALVGPTGVGKTTTIAKLAAIYAVGIGGEKPLSVRMITIDNYRIGARQQIETYGNIMGVPVSCVETVEDLKKTLDLHADADLILVDTIGKSPRDAVKLAEVQRLVAACGQKAEVHLALAATTKSSDMVEILRQFEPFNYRAVVLTKLDETDRIGNALSVLAEKRKPVSYLTTGQRVPQDIERAETTRLLMCLPGFRPDRARLEARYGDAAGRPEPGRADRR